MCIVINSITVSAWVTLWLVSALKKIAENAVERKLDLL